MNIKLKKKKSLHERKYDASDLPCGCLDHSGDLQENDYSRIAQCLAWKQWSNKIQGQRKKQEQEQFSKAGRRVFGSQGFSKMWQA